MLRNVLAATLRNLIRNQVYALISIGGLAIGMAAVILTGLYVRDEVSFDSFIPGRDKTYVAIWAMDLPGRAPVVADWTQNDLAQQLKLDFKEVQAAARLYLTPDRVGIRRGEIEGQDSIGWADPDLFRILRAPAVAGDPATALDRPDGVVITRAMARKYFGEDAPIGKVLELNRIAKLRVVAVLYDLPANTDLTFQIYASSASPFSMLNWTDKRPKIAGNLSVDVRTYLRLPGGAASAARLNAAMPAFVRRHLAGPDGKLAGGARGAYTLIPLRDLYLYPLRGTPLTNLAPHGDASALKALSVIAALVLGLACVNFVNLMTGRAARRAVEVGVRKASGARRRDLVLQFVGEALVYTFIALLLALAMVEAVLPLVRALADRPLMLDYWSDPRMVGVLVLLATVVGILTGLYPALVQSAFRPALVLKGALPRTSGSAAIRGGLTAAQFAVLIGLILAVMVIGLQTHYAMNQGLNLDKARMVTMDITTPARRIWGALPGPITEPCRDTLVDRIRRIPGVLGAACSASNALDADDRGAQIQTPSGPVDMKFANVDRGFFELYGLKPVAGRFFSAAHPEDEPTLGDNAKLKTAVVSEAAARTLGFAHPRDALGHTFRLRFWGTFQIVGVVRDFTFDLSKGEMRPAIYQLWPSLFDTLSIKLSGDDVPGVLKAIDAEWSASGALRPPQRRFVDDYLRAVYATTIRQGRLLDILCAVAVALACLGLFGLASFTAEQRTKEIGVRKAMGASRQDVARLLLWSFSQPVLWANLIAWPLAWWALSRWLAGFARHIALEPWMFIAAAMAALAVALATVLAHTLRIASVRPVGALRYE